MHQVIAIDEIRLSGFADECKDVFEIEWFETQKHLFNRQTISGVELRVEKGKWHEWKQGDVLLHQGKSIAVIHIKKSLIIRLASENAQDTADFCYYVGNRHLPLFADDKLNFIVPYDGNLYEQLLAKMEDKIYIEEQQLLMNQLVKRIKNKE